MRRGSRITGVWANEAGRRSDQDDPLESRESMGSARDSPVRIPSASGNETA
jgi:hypothetical protein